MITRFQMFDALSAAVAGKMMDQEMADAIADILIESSGEKEGGGIPCCDVCGWVKKDCVCLPAPSPGPSSVQDDYSQPQTITTGPSDASQRKLLHDTITAGFSGKSAPTAPMPEVEEAMGRLEFAARDATHARQCVFGMPLEYANKNWAKDKKALDVIRAALKLRGGEGK